MYTVALFAVVIGVMIANAFWLRSMGVPVAFIAVVNYFIIMPMAAPLSYIWHR